MFSASEQFSYRPKTENMKNTPTAFAIVFASDSVTVPDTNEFTNPKDAYFALSYMEGCEGMAVMGTDAAGGIYLQSGQAWEKSA